MKVLFDRSVIVAAHLPSHADYPNSRFWLERARQNAFEFVVAAHTLLETFSVLTRLPLTQRIMPSIAFHFIETNFLSVAKVVSLTAGDCQDLLKSLAITGTSGGVVYDSLLVKTAELTQADVLLTLNLKHFKRSWPANYAKIHTPNPLTPP